MPGRLKQEKNHQPEATVTIRKSWGPLDPKAPTVLYHWKPLPGLEPWARSGLDLRYLSGPFKAGDALQGRRPTDLDLHWTVRLGYPWTS